MAENQVSVDGTLRPLSAMFFVVATQNPVESAGPIPCLKRRWTALPSNSTWAISVRKRRLPMLAIGPKFCRGPFPPWDKNFSVPLRPRPGGGNSWFRPLGPGGCCAQRVGVKTQKNPFGWRQLGVGFLGPVGHPVFGAPKGLTILGGQGPPGPFLGAPWFPTFSRQLGAPCPEGAFGFWIPLGPFPRG